MRSTNTNFDTEHARAYKTPVYYIEFDDEPIKYGNHILGASHVEMIWGDIVYTDAFIDTAAFEWIDVGDGEFVDHGAAGDSEELTYMMTDNNEYLVWASGGTYRNYLVDIRGGAQRVTPEEGRASIGGITFSLLDYDDQITALLATDTYYFHRKKVTIKTGYLGMVEADYLTIMIGWITDIKLGGNGLNYVFTVTDPIKWMQRKIFRGAEDSSVTISGNAINIVLQVLTSTGAGTNGDYDTLAAANGLGIDEDYINVTAIEAVRDDWFPGPAHRFTFTIDKRVQAKKWLEQEIFKVLNIYPVIDADGKFNLKPFKPPLPATETVQSFTEDNIIGMPGWTMNLGATINEVECHYDWDDTDDEFDTHDFYVDSTSVNNRGPGKSPLVLESKGLTGATGEDFFARRKANVFGRYATPPPKLNLQTFFSRWLTEAGDIVPVTHSKVPDISNGSRGITAENMEVINRSIDWKRGKVKVEALATSFGRDPYCQISPSMTVVTGISATRFTVSAADAAKFSAGEEIAMHYANMVVQSANVTITDITGTTITVDSLGATPAAGWIAQYAAYDSCTTDQQLYWFLSDGSDYLGAANDAAHLVTA